MEEGFFSWREGQRKKDRDWRREEGEGELEGYARKCRPRSQSPTLGMIFSSVCKIIFKGCFAIVYVLWHSLGTTDLTSASFYCFDAIDIRVRLS